MRRRPEEAGTDPKDIPPVDLAGAIARRTTGTRVGPLAVREDQVDALIEDVRRQLRADGDWRKRGRDTSLTTRKDWYD